MEASRRFGKYLLHDRIAVGGMGELYLASRLGAARGTPPSVLKILLPEYSSDADYVTMFHDEARIGMQLAHPNIIGVHDLGRVGESPYLVLEYVHGENLRAVQRALEARGERFPPALVIEMGIDVLLGLDHAHRATDGRGRSMNLVHRDLSPDNVMISFDGDTKVLDFGIAKTDGRATHTQFGILKGKIQYMAPEQTLNDPVDARTDVYAVALVLLELLTGEGRFTSVSDPLQMVRQARTWMPKGPSESDPSLPVELDAILLKALQQEPDRRWASAGELAHALKRLLRNGSVPRSSEHLPGLMCRLFPDRAEPFLVTEPTGTASAEKVREAMRRATVPSPEDSLPDDVEMIGDLPDEETLLGAFLSRGETTSAPIVSGRAVPRPHASSGNPAPGDSADSDVTVETARGPALAGLDDPTFPGGPAPLGSAGQETVVGPAPASLDESSLDRTVVGAMRPGGSEPSRPERPRPRAGLKRAHPPPAPLELPLEEEDLGGDLVEEGTQVAAGPPGRPQSRGSRAPPAAELRARPKGALEESTQGGDFSLPDRPIVERPSRRSKPVRSRGFGRMLFGLSALLILGASVAALRPDLLPRPAGEYVTGWMDRIRTGEFRAGSVVELAPGSGAVEIEEAPGGDAASTGTTGIAVEDSPGDARVEVAAEPEDDQPESIPAGSAAVGGGVFPGATDASEVAMAPDVEGAPEARRTPVPRPTETPAATASSGMSPGKASVRILSVPTGFEILVDGEPTGKRTPATVEVDPGSRILSLKAEGFRPWTFAEEFQAGDTLQLRADLYPE